ncbi:MAG: hypothetical protein AMXMBFR46_10780 [Acidimicrobiia bacterium]
MSLGPIELFVFGFPGNEFKGEIAPALADLVESGTVRIVDLLFLLKDADGNTAAFEASELDESISAQYVALVDEIQGFLTDEDVEDFAEELEPNSAVALLVVEHLWAKPFADAVVNAGGMLMGSLHVPREVVDEITARA